MVLVLQNVNAQAGVAIAKISRLVSLAQKTISTVVPWRRLVLLAARRGVEGGALRVKCAFTIRVATPSVSIARTRATQMVTDADARPEVEALNVPRARLAIHRAIA